jgi:hypothetical protein
MRRVAFFAFFALSAGLVVPLLSSVARADEPPPKGYVEPCTLAIQCASGRVCAAVVGKIDPKCANEASAAGMRERCRTQGATHASAIFCPNDAPVPSEAEVNAKTGKGCRGCTTASGESAGGVVLALGCALAAARRRGTARRRPSRGARFGAGSRGAVGAVDADASRPLRDAEYAGPPECSSHAAVQRPPP